MDIRVSGHQVDTGEALQTHVETRLGSIAEKYFSKALSSHATFGRAPHDGFTSDIVMHVMQGLVLKGRGEARTRMLPLTARQNASRNNCAVTCAACKIGMNKRLTPWRRKKRPTLCLTQAMTMKRRPCRTRQ